MLTEWIGVPVSFLWSTWAAACIVWRSRELMGGFNQNRTTRLNIGHLFLNIFINDLFPFIEKWTLYYYPDENPMPHSSSTLPNYALAAELILVGLIKMEWKRALLNNNLWNYCPTRLMELNWIWTGIASLNVKSHLRLWESLLTIRRRSVTASILPVSKLSGSLML